MTSPNSRNPKDNEKIEQFIKDLFALVSNSENVVITSHLNADPDSLAAVITLRAFFLLYTPSLAISIVLTDLDLLAQQLYDRFKQEDGLWNLESHWPTTTDILILVDTNDINMVDFESQEGSQSQTPVFKQGIIIDHHLAPDKLDPRFPFNLILPEYTSVAEIVFEFFKLYQSFPPISIAKLILAGIITDTGHFRFATAQTLENTKLLLDHGIQLTDVTSNLQGTVSRPEKIARLRAAMRIQELHYLQSYIVAFSHVSSFGASACKALIELGADISFVVSFNIKQHRFHISSRAREEVIQKYSLHLGKIMQEVGVHYNGLGGGHSGAAGCYGEIPQILADTDHTAAMHQIEKFILACLRKIIN